MSGTYGEHLHHKGGEHLRRGVLDNAVCQRCWYWMSEQLASWYSTAQVRAGRGFMALPSSEWQEVLVRSCNPKMYFMFAHVILTNTLGVIREIDIRFGIGLWIELC